MAPVEPSLELWVTLGLIAAAVAAYASERLPIELVSATVVAALLLFFHIRPVSAPGDENMLDAGALLAGFANPALIAVLGLLVIGQGMVRTGALDHAIHRLIVLRRHHPATTIGLTLLSVIFLSAVLNNTPVVVIFIPIMTALAERMGRSASGVMIPLSYAAILGGMTTLIGSSTNLLVSSTAVGLGFPAIGFFDFTIPGLVLAAAGFVYVALVAPRILPDRASPVQALVEGGGKQFLAQIEVRPGGILIGERPVAGMFEALPDVTVRLIQRGEHAFLPPFDGVVLRRGDEIVLAATRKALTEVVEHAPELFHGDADIDVAASQMIGEVVVAPASRMIGRSLTQLGFHYQTHCIVLGIQRRSRMIRARMDEIRLDAGDVLLVYGRHADIVALRANRDVLLLERSTRELVDRTKVGRAIAIFAAVVALSATGIVPIVICAVAGAAAMVVSGCLNIHQAARAMDRQIIFLVGAALALGAAMSATGGAAYLAHIIVSAFGGGGAAVTLSVLFLLIAVITNVLSNNATAVLFILIALGAASELGVDPRIFLYAVIFAANCSFATPMNADGISDQSSGHGTGTLSLRRLRPRRRPAGVRRLGNLFTVRAVVLWSLVMPTAVHTFYRTPPLPCPYIPGRMERKLFAVLDGVAAKSVHERLSQAGFRRSHNIVYRPACEGCSACRAVRVCTAPFRPGRSMRRVLARNASIVAREAAPVASAEQFQLFRRYQTSRHPGGGMADMDFEAYRAMVEDTPVQTFVVEFRRPDGELYGVSVGDRLGDGLSLVYSFFLPEGGASPGTFIILWHIERARALGLDYVYLGYWIAGSPKMGYKARFQPLEVCTERGWEPAPAEANSDLSETAVLSAPSPASSQPAEPV